MGTPNRQVDTIAAIATAPGRSGIGVVRVSGAGLATMAQALTGRTLAPRTATLCNFLDAHGGVIDRGIALFFPAPRSYTGEDVLELQGHGSPVALAELLRRCVSLGARPAGPGEFTQRAFLNGKLDLAQAEAVADLIEATTSAAARSAMRSLSGAFSREIQLLSDELVALRALVEAAIDFPEEETEVLANHDVTQRISSLRRRLAELTGRARSGSMLRRGLRVVLAGRPNVGKSSLLNRLAGEDRAIVTPIPGTTRDALREAIEVGGMPLHVVDTAGLRHTEDEVERLGIGRAWDELRQADLVVLLCDACEGVGDYEREIVGGLPAGIPVLTVLNKVDLTTGAASLGEGEFGVSIALSAKTGAGMDLLEQELLRVAGLEGAGEDVVSARERHLIALAECDAHLDGAQKRAGRIELMAEELRLAHEAIGRITGKFLADDLLGEIFGRFCLGK